MEQFEDISQPDFFLKLVAAFVRGFIVPADARAILISGERPLSISR
jgi:hypothetical protein